MTSCVHHWLCEPGNFNVRARCKRCGAERVFTGQLMDGLRMTTGGSPAARRVTAEDARVAAQSRAKGGQQAAARSRERAAALLSHQLAREEARGL